jgi:hypothetical protein
MKQTAYPWIKWLSRFALGCMTIGAMGTIFSWYMYLYRGTLWRWDTVVGHQVEELGNSIGFRRKPYDGLTLIDTRPEHMYEAPGNKGAATR